MRMHPEYEPCARALVAAPPLPAHRKTPGPTPLPAREVPAGDGIRPQPDTAVASDKAPWPGHRREDDAPENAACALPTTAPDDLAVTPGADPADHHLSLVAAFAPQELAGSMIPLATEAPPLWSWPPVSSGDTGLPEPVIPVSAACYGVSSAGPHDLANLDTEDGFVAMATVTAPTDPVTLADPGGHLAGRPPCDRAASLWDIPPQVALAHQTLWPDFFHGPDDPGMPIPAPPCYLPFTADLPVEPAPYQQTGSPRVLSVLSHRLRDSDDFWW